MSCSWGILVVQRAVTAHESTNVTWGMREETDSDTLLHCCIEGQSQHMWARVGNLSLTHTHTHHPGYPSRSFPPDAEAIGTVSCPLSPSWRTAPSFLEKKLYSLEQPGLRPLFLRLPVYITIYLSLIQQCKHTPKVTYSDLRAADRNTLKAPWFSRWPSGYSIFLCLRAFHSKLLFWSGSAE